MTIVIRERRGISPEVTLTSGYKGIIKRGESMKDRKEMTNEEVFEILHHKLAEMTVDEFYNLLVDAGIKDWPRKGEWDNKEG